MLAAAALAGCDRTTPGTFRFEKVTVSDDHQVAQRMDPMYQERPGPVLRVELSMDREVMSTNNGMAMIMQGDFCPFRNDDFFRVNGPFPDDLPELDGNDTRRAMRDTTGRYHYTAYIQLWAKPADIANDTRDLCLRAKSMAYFPPHSATFVVPHSQIAALIPEIIRREDALRLKPQVSK